MPTRTSKRMAIAITPTVKIGLDGGVTRSTEGPGSLPRKLGTVGPDDSNVGAPRPGRISVAGAAESRASKSGVPSSRQKLSVSSSYLRLHFGQLFMSLSADYADYEISFPPWLDTSRRFSLIHNL